MAITSVDAWHEIKIIESDYYAYSNRGIISRSKTINNINHTETMVFRNLVVYGLHYQTEAPQSVMLSVLSGSAFIVFVDLRTRSKKLGQYFSSHQIASRQVSLYAPEGFAWGVVSLTDETVIRGYFTKPFDDASSQTLLWNDPEIGINWPVRGSNNVLLSTKERSGKTFATLKAEGLLL